jgi:3-methylcrotonyl-CoA carboxylase alpha subunit
MIQSLLIANRGEIACRIIRTARAMGVRTVAVYSDADANALHVRQADEAVHIGPSPARESYLVGEKIIAAAKQTSAEAIHPGYGFLSENAAFAQAVIDAGLVWVGPSPASITAMGLKDAAKTLMAAAGVPVTPGYMGAEQDSAFLAAEAGKIGYPVLIKAVAGGGGKGMRLVERPEDFLDALASCQREATSAFGNDRVLIEKYILSPRHIEVQVFGDGHGNLVHLFERDCSLQRRHQKVIEEAPAPGMDAATREALCGAALRAAKAVDYVGAGTIEFIADGSAGLRADRIWFMEMNTRLQVEHPVTEEITGVDLVEWQLRVASGEKLPKRQDELAINGWAMEARLYAEDPAKGFLPSTGRLERLGFPGEVRIETGVEEGDTISDHYDPMIAKVIAHGEDRGAALRHLRWAMSATRIAPVRTNASFLYRLLSRSEVVDGALHTGLIADHQESLTIDRFLHETLRDDAATMLLGASINDRRWCSPSIALLQQMKWQSRPWHQNFGFRLNGDWDHTIAFREGGETIVRKLPEDFFERKLDFWDMGANGSVTVFRKGEFLEAQLRWDGAHGASAGDGAILSPMPGRIIAVDVARGQTVAKGQKLLTLEAMKMEHTLVAPFDGVVTDLNAVVGGQVQVEALLARIVATED